MTLNLAILILSLWCIAAIIGIIGTVIDDEK